MSENAIDNENAIRRSPNGRAKPARKRNPQKVSSAKKAASKPKADRTNKKAEVIAMMKRAKSATLPEIMKANGWTPKRVLENSSCP